MESKIRTVMLAAAGALAISTSTHAASVSGSGCNNFGTVSYAYVNAGTSLLLLSGGACFVSSLNSGEAATLGAMATEAMSSGRSIAVGTGASLGGGTPTGLSVAMQ